MSELVLYNQMRVAIAKCAKVDEAAGIKNKATQLEAYARIRDDAEAQRQFAEIRLRACIRIGEISRDLPHGKPGPKSDQNQLTDNDVSQFDKEDVLKRSGLTRRTANRYEELAGGRDEQIQQIATAAAEVYFGSGEPVSMGGLKHAVQQALATAFGVPMPTRSSRSNRNKHELDNYKPDLLVDFLYSANHASEKHDFDPIELANRVMEEFAQEELDSCRNFIPLLEKFIQRLKERFKHVR